MTYKEFKKWCKRKGCVIEEDSYCIFVKNTSEMTLAIINKNQENEAELNTCFFPLIEKALELAKTPLEERESQKKYYIVVSGSDNYNCDGHLFISDGEENEDYKTKFTKQEAEEIMKKLSFEMVEVEG